MKNILQKLIKVIAYSGAAIVILLAVAVGIFRLMLPRLPEYQDEIKGWASSAIGVDVEFSNMNARWRLSGPELSFFDASLRRGGDSEALLQADEVSVGVGLLRLITDRELVVDRVSIRDTAIDVRQDESGAWLLQGVPFADLVGSRDLEAKGGGNVEIVGQNIDVQYEHPASGQIMPFTISSLNVSRRASELVVEADVDLVDEFGRRIEVSANQLNQPFGDNTWRVFVVGESLNVSGWSRLQPVGQPEIDSGVLDVNLWVDFVAGKIQHANANVVVNDLHIQTEQILAPVGILGSFEYSAEADGWLIGANQMRVSTVDGDWPNTDLQVRVTHDAGGVMQSIRTTASFFDLNDLKYVAGWLPDAERDRLNAYNPSGRLRALNLDVSALQSESPDFSVSADLDSIGIASVGDQPGFREFSGQLRADRDGGRVEIESTDLRLDVDRYLREPLILDDAIGTIIWRRSGSGTTVLSDSVSVRNADFDSQLSLQISIPDGDAAPVVDFESSWSVYDVSAMPRYLPLQGIMPPLRQWLTDALISGRVNRGTTRLFGSMDEFPFDDGGGEFRIEAELSDVELLYSPKWPAPEFEYLEVVVDGMRLYSHVNSAVNLGNAVENARIEIADLRAPVLNIDAFATGTLESIKAYVANSPIDDVLGGQIDRVEVDGDASFDLSIVYPIQDKENYDFNTRIQISDGKVEILGFDPPISGLNGRVSISRDDASSEGLFGTFLGQQVDLDLQRIGDNQAPHSVVLNAAGRTTTSALQDEFGVTLDGVLEGETAYTAVVRFPNGQGPRPGPLQIDVESSLAGFESALPVPLSKTAQVAMPLSLNIEFPAQGQITTAGTIADDILWSASFLKSGDTWDFDRGVLTVGDEPPRQPDVRGLHIHGNTRELDLHAWLAAGRRGDRQLGLADRIRSINLQVDDFYAVGQKFSHHEFSVDRSGQSWIVQVSGEEALGQVTVPYDFNAGRPLTLEMQRLILPGGDDEPVSEAADLIDPRILPGISIRADEFGIGLRRMGSLVVDFAKTNRGLEASNLKSTDDTFTIEGGAGWIIDAYEETGQRTFFDAILRSTNVAETFNRLDYEPGIIGDSMNIDLEVGWAGGPRGDFMGVINGNVSVSLGEGQLADVEPGAGRVFGLMSFQALPRRLSLDFRDVFETGFSFDRITGNFRLLEGDAFTCDLTVAGTAADFGIVGRTGLATRDYDQSAVVGVNVGNTLPVVGGILGGPQVAAALFVFSQLFKKPLKDMGQAYYSVDGSWDEPLIERADSQRFVETSSLASCIDVAQQ